MSDFELKSFFGTSQSDFTVILSLLASPEVKEVGRGTANFADGSPLSLPTLPLPGAYSPPEQLQKMGPV